MVGRLGVSHLELYDESRRAVSAVEMALGESHPLVPTYAGKPDHWGTKPPLLIWIQAAAISVFGANEFAVRLPSALASICLFILLIWWARRDWGSPLVGAIAGLVVCANTFYLDNHGARSGDYDALLLLFLVGQLVGAFRKNYWLLGATILLAGWTKGIAGCLFLPGIALWLLADREARASLRKPYVYLAVAAGLVGIAAYYGLRARVDPGYWQLVTGNELSGRFLAVNEGHREPWYHYLDLLFFRDGFSILGGLGVVGLLLRGGRSQRPNPGLLVGLTALTYWLVITLAATKLFWYQSPLLPLLGLGAGSLLVNLGRRYRGAGWVVAAVSAVVFLRPVAGGFDRLADPEARLGTENFRLKYREFLADPAVEPPYTIAVPAYQAAAEWEAARVRYRGGEVGVKHTSAYRVPGSGREALPDSFAVGERVVVCENEAWKALSDRHEWTDLHRAGACKLITSWRRK